MKLKKLVSIFALTGILVLPILYKDSKYTLAQNKEDNQDLNPTDLSFSSIRNGFSIILRGTESVLQMASTQTAGIFTDITCTIKEVFGGTCEEKSGIRYINVLLFSQNILKLFL